MKSIVSLAEPVSYAAVFVSSRNACPLFGEERCVTRQNVSILGTLADLSLGAIAVTTICLYPEDLKALFVTCDYLVLNLNCPILLCSYFLAIA